MSRRTAMKRNTAMSRIAIPLAAGAATLLAASHAYASGFSTARFGFEHGHPMTDEPTAIFYNPSGLSQKPGIDIMVDGAVAYRLASYTRTAPSGPRESDGELADGPLGNSGESTLTNVAAAPMIGAKLGFELSDDITLAFGAGFFVPFGGAATWGQNDAWEGSTTAPGPVDGVQRWYSIHGTLRSLYISGAASLGISDLVHIGVSGGVAITQIDTLRARNGDGGSAIGSEGRAWLDVQKANGQFGAGVMLTPLEGKLKIGASYQAPPGFGEQKLEGNLVTQLGGQISGRENQVELTQHLPDIFRLGLSYRFTDLELRAFADLQRWSLFADQCIAQAGQNCEVNEDGSDKDGSASTANLPRRWKDAGGVRVGMSYWFDPTIELMVGAGYDSNAIPAQNMDPALTDFHDISAALGLKLQPIPQFGAMLGYTHLFYIPRDTTGTNINPNYLGNSTGPDAGGEYTQTIGVFQVYVMGSFDPFTPAPQEQAKSAF